ncbi:hypothetical protein BGZ76_006566 [Entomortierella beljakovae]|nr:hypothetical protein BGZ76_006566 [Entomortierella beljakovae]
MVDDVAFFCFFTFRNWKRLILADAPRQVINATILYQTFRGHPFNFEPDGVFDWNSVVPGSNVLLKKISLGAMIFTVFMFIISLLQLIAAVILYIPLVSHIQGNLKEYCCHKIDKRIDELIRKKSKSRATDEAAKADGALAFKQPTLPNVDITNPVPPRTPAPTPRTPASAPRTPAHVPRTAATPTPRTPFQNAQTPYHPQTPKNNYNNIPPQYQSQPPLPQQQQGGYDYYPSKPTQPVVQSKHVDPYAETAYTADKYYTNNQSQQNQSGYGYNNPYPQVAGAGANYAGSSNNSKRSSPSYSNTPLRARQYDEYGQPRPASPNHSHHGSDLDSHHSSQPTYGYGVPRASGGGSSVGLYNNNNNNNNNNSNSNSNIASYGNPRQQPRNGAAVFEGEYQTPPRRQDNSHNQGGYRGGGY